MQNGEFQGSALPLNQALGRQKQTESTFSELCNLKDLEQIGERLIKKEITIVQ